LHETRWRDITVSKNNLKEIKMSNQLERALIQSVVLAHKKYETLTDGHWLWHAPESYVQAMTATHVHKKLGVSIYLESTPGQVERDAIRLIKRGPRPDVNKQQRFDLIVWWKREKSPRAIIELKMTYASSAGVTSDANKLISFKKEAKNLKIRHGYLLVVNSAYRNLKLKKERQGRETIRHRLEKLAESLQPEFKMVACMLSKDINISGTQARAFGVALYRLDFEKLV
jgi:hypothetical protein